MVRKSGKYKTIAKSSVNVLDNPCNELHIAALEGAVDVVRTLLQEGSHDINALGERGFTALHFAANSGQLEVSTKRFSESTSLTRPIFSACLDM